MPGVSVDGNDVEAVRDCVANAAVRVSAGGGPTRSKPSLITPPDFSDLTAAAIATRLGSEYSASGSGLIFARSCG